MALQEFCHYKSSVTTFFCLAGCLNVEHTLNGHQSKSNELKCVLLFDDRKCHHEYSAVVLVM